MTENINKDLLAQIVAGKVTFISQADGMPLLKHHPALIEVNTASIDPSDATKVACRATAAAADYLKPKAAAEPSKYAIITGAVLPPTQRRGNPSGSGAPTKYPFADLPVGGSFFSANSEHGKGDAVKALGSTISAQNRKYATPVTENGVAKTRTVTRALRDNKTHKALLNADGSKQTETVELPVLDYSRKFTIRPVKGGEKYGDWTAPSDGALVHRSK